MEAVVYPPGYYDPPQEVVCPIKGCEDGLLWGIDANGSQVSEPCVHRCHMSEADLQAEAGDRRYDEERDAAIR